MLEWTNIQQWLNHNLGVAQVVAVLIFGFTTITTTILIIWREEIKTTVKNKWGSRYKLSPRNIKWTTKNLFNAAKEKRVRAEYIDLTTQTRNAIGELLIKVRQLAVIVQTLIVEQKPQNSELTERITRLVEYTQEAGKNGKFTPMYQQIADIDNIRRKILDKDKKWEVAKRDKNPRRNTSPCLSWGDTSKDGDLKGYVK